MKAKIALVICFLLSSGCDFSSRLQKDILKAQQYFKKNNYRLAAKQYESILKQTPPEEVRTKVLFQLGEIYNLYLAEEKLAIEQFEKIVKTSSQPSWIVKSTVKSADIYFHFLKDYKKCIDLYKKLINFKPKISSTDLFEHRLGISLTKVDEFKKAQDVFKKISQDVTHTYYNDSFYYLGLIQFNQKEWKKAISFWDQFLRREKRKDKLVETKFLIANAYETMEELKKAYRIYYSILGEHPNPEMIKNRLTSLYKRRIARKR